jgi:hypothetical protein
LEFFPSVFAATEDLKQCIRATKHFRATHRHTYTASEQAIFDMLKQVREDARRVRDAELLNCLTIVSNSISQKSFKIEIRQVAGPKGKPVYIIPESPTDLQANCYYAIKQISQNIARIYKVKQANRNNIVSQLSDFLNDGFPYHIVKADVQSFYESIDHELLLSKLRSDQLLSTITIRLIEMLLRDYAKLAGTPGKGLPRGVGISAILAELYMRGLDRNVASFKGVAFYARYVDDIVILFAPTKGSLVSHHEAQIIEELRSVKLLMNGPKSDSSPPDKAGWHLTYLGYSFKYSNSSSCEILMSDDKFQRYKQRLKASFSRYHQQRAKNAKKAYRLLVKRIQFLTSNTQLSHSKQNAYVGIYFSNPHLSAHMQLESLDSALTSHISGVSHSAKLTARLQAYSFKQGYTEQVFRRFHREGEFSEITKAWKYGQ